MTEKPLTAEWYGREYHPNTVWVLNWIDRMTARYGPGCFDAEVGHAWDWGQALARLRYGVNWMQGDGDGLPDDPDDESLWQAQQWESGEQVPTWFRPKETP